MDTFNKIFEIIDDNGQKMPEFVYLELMNLFKVHHQEMTDNIEKAKNERAKSLREIKSVFFNLTQEQDLKIKTLEQEKKDLVAELMFEKKKTNKLIEYVEKNENTKIEFSGLNFQNYLKKYNNN
jgi:flagellar motility protein MotE (MotC chaperone)